MTVSTQYVLVCSTWHLFCLFVVGFSPREIFEKFSLIWKRHNCREGLQILIYTRHSWQLSKKGSTACHTFCDTGTSVYNDHLQRTPDTHTYCRAFRSGAVTTLFYDLGLSRLGFEHPTFCIQGKRTVDVCVKKSLHIILLISNLDKKPTCNIAAVWFIRLLIFPI